LREFARVCMHLDTRIEQKTQTQENLAHYDRQNGFWCWPTSASWEGGGRGGRDVILGNHTCMCVCLNMYICSYVRESMSFSGSITSMSVSVHVCMRVCLHVCMLVCLLVGVPL